MTAAVDRAPAASRGILAALFAVYLVLLVWLVLFKLHDPFIGDAAARAVKLVPFVRTDAAGSSAPREVLGNLLVFVPFGVYLRLLTRWRWWTIAGTIAATSAALELAQYVLAVGVTDVTDIITNTAGGVTGLVIAAIVQRMLRHRTTAVVTVLGALGTLLVVAVVALHVLDRPGIPASVGSTIYSCAC